MEYGELKKQLRIRVQERMDYFKDMTDAEVEDVIDSVKREIVNLPFRKYGKRVVPAALHWQKLF